MTQSEIYDRVDAWRMARDQANDRLYALITELRHQGATWVQLGNALGTSPQAAQQRFGTTRLTSVGIVRDTQPL